MKTRLFACLFASAVVLPSIFAAAAQPQAVKKQPTVAPPKAPAAPVAAPAPKATTSTAPTAPAVPAPANETVTPLNRDGARHQLINSRAKENAGNVDLLFLGDSITQGWESAGKDVWEKFYGERKAMNAGIGGDRTQHILWRLENGNIDGISPKLAVLMIGTNNSANNTSEQIAAGVKAIVAKLRKALPQTKVLVLAIFPRGPNKDDVRRKVNEGANAIIQSVADGRMVHYLDIGPKFLEEDGTLSKEIMPDLLHLSPAGYTIWAESIDDKVAQLLGEQGAVTASTSTPRRRGGFFRRLFNR
jgi:lysophospholipase L1-like esterase